MLEHATYFETANHASFFDIVLDVQGRPVVGGDSIDVDLPTTPGAFQEVYQGNGDAIVARLDPTLSAVDYCTYLGGEIGYDRIISIGMMTTGELVVGGFTSSSDLPTTPDAWDDSFAGSSSVSPQDGWVSVLDLDSPGASSLIYSTFLGGPAEEEVDRLCIDSEDRVVLSVRTRTSSSTGDLPITPGTFDPDSIGGSPDAYFLRLRVRDSQFRRGDINDDATLNIADAVSLLTTLFVVGGSAIECEDAADANDDGLVDIADAVFVLAALFSQGAPPPSPGPSMCGDDPTGDAIGCALHDSCP
jgi:hypothetical protein